MSVCGAVPKFLEDIVEILAKEIGIRKNKVCKRNRQSTWGFGYQGTPALRIRDWMYTDATVWMECKRCKFYSYEYSSLRPQDKKHQEQIINAEMKQRGWKLLSEYKGYYKSITIQCDKGHIWTTL